MRSWKLEDNQTGEKHYGDTADELQYELENILDDRDPETKTLINAMCRAYAQSTDWTPYARKLDMTLTEYEWEE